MLLLVRTLWLVWAALAAVGIQVERGYARAMCGRFALYAPASRLRESFEVSGDDLAYAPRYNIAPLQLAPVIRQRPSGERVAHLLRWGLVPSWARDESMATKLINARAETLAERPSFRSAYRSRRCVIPANGFYEWQRIGSHKQPYFILPADSEIFALGGLWERWMQPDGEALDTFTVITTDANEAMAPIHDRMPLILAPSDLGAWLDKRTGPDVLRKLLAPCPAGGLTMYAVGLAVGNVRNEGPGLIAPLEVAKVPRA